MQQEHEQTWAMSHGYELQIGAAVDDADAVYFSGSKHWTEDWKWIALFFFFTADTDL